MAANFEPCKFGSLVYRDTIGKIDMRLGRIVALGMVISLVAMVAASSSESALAQENSECVTGGAVTDAANTGLISDCEALLGARDTLAGTGGSLDWSADTPIGQWEGVTLRGTPQRVTELTLSFKGLDGTIPSGLGNLNMLTHLNLRSNDLSGSIPSSLGDLSSLTYLNLHSNDLSGGIPDLSRISGLEELYLANNADYNEDGSKVRESGLTGMIPTWLNGMTNMRELWLWGNSLTGSVPDLSGMTSLDKLKLANNDLMGGIPEASQLPPNMTWLIIDRNPFGGTVPNLSSLSRLRLLWLHSNSLTGSVPDGSNFPASLDDLNLRDNALTGTIPDLSNLGNLTRLRLHNNSLSGEVPATLGDLDSLKQLWLHNEDATKTDHGNNSFTSIHADLAGLADTLIEIALRGNAWADDACVPAALEDVATNDYDEAGLDICEDDSTAGDSPDLQIQAPSVDNASPETGATFTLSTTVTNVGDEDSEATTLRYYLSVDETIDDSDTEVGTASVGALAAAGASDHSIGLTAPSTAGTYYYGACVDTVTDESDTTDNCSAAVQVDVEDSTTLHPDLAVETPSVNDASPVKRATFTLSATVTNAGEVESAATTLRYYRSTDATISGTDTQVGTDSVRALAADGTSDQSISLTAPSTAGTYYYGACVDAVTDESDTTNNCSASVKVDVEESNTPRPTRPDLEVGAPTVYGTTLGPEAPFTMYVTVTNAGDGSSAAATLRYYRSTDVTITRSDTEVGTDAVGSLAADGASEQSIDLTAPTTMATYFYGACMDAVSGESDTTDNCSSSVEITMAAPDLEFDGGAQAGPLLSTDGLFRIVVGVENTGRGKSAPTTIRFYRSTDTTITTSDVEIETHEIEALRPGGRGIGRSTWLAPPSALGNHYHGACWDAVPGESNTANNCSTYFTATVKPNLEVPEVEVSDSSLETGETFTLTATVKNTGLWESTATTLRYYQRRGSPGLMTRSATEVGTSSVGVLASADESELSIQLKAPPWHGTHYYGGCVDAIPNEQNSNLPSNCSQGVALTVESQPDLTVSLTVNRTEVKPGWRFTLSATATNEGEANSRQTRLRYYRSDDASISTSDTEIGMDWVGTLAPAATEEESVSQTAPSTTTPLTYYYGACVDVLTDESDTTNNCSDAVKVTVKVQPDLQILGGKGYTPPLVPEGSFYLTARLENEGDGEAPATTLRAYRSEDTEISTSDTELTTKEIEAHAPGDITHHRFNLTAPDTPGTYYYGSCVDTVTDESDTTNNCTFATTLVVPVPAPDLTVLAKLSRVHSILAPGTPVTLSARVFNVGAEDAGATTLRFYRSDDGQTISSADTELGTETVGALASAENSEYSIDITAPMKPGDYDFGACVDTVTGELVTENNCSDGKWMRVTAPDLEVRTPSVDDASPATGGAFTLSATVTNVGYRESVATTLRYYRSTDATITTSDTEVGTDDVGALSRSDTSDQSIDLTAPTTARTYYYGACVDTVTYEYYTTDNCSASVKVDVGNPTPDLEVGTPSVNNATLGTGAAFTLSVTVTNAGNGESPGTTLRYYRSTDVTITSDDTEVDSSAVGVLVPSRASNQSIDLTAPSETGTYYYGVCVDSVTDESDTTDNCSVSVSVVVE